MKKNILLAVLIGGVFVALMAVFALGLNNNPNDLDLVTKGKKIPEFSLPALMDDEVVSNTDLKSDKPYFILNFFGSWCPSCYQEHPFLLSLSKAESLYGVNWKDDRKDGQKFIRDMGNPFKKIIVDNESELAINLGVYGAPETYLIQNDGTILYRYAGALDKTVWDKEFVPKINALENKK